MARKNDSPQKAAMRKMMRDYLKNNDISIKNGTDIVVRQIKRGCFRQIKTVRQEASGKHHVTLLSVYSAHWKKQQTTHAD